MNIRVLITLLLTTIVIGGCASTAFVAGATTSGVIIYDRRSIQAIATDQKIIIKTKMALQKDHEIQDRTHIDITAFNRIVLLLGQAPNQRLADKVLAIVLKTPKIKKIYNYISIQGPSSGLTRSSDTWITTKIKSKMLATEHLRSSQIKVLTENGSVYMLGEVSRHQANVAVNIARRVAGVQRVIKLFTYIN